ncbi:calcium-binding protein [Chromobacterium sp. IIBBL 290-4]|uniref:calcium-binding protein n=1 Tax=Chromobacterium sp. IIBBL 290-4 TaxID=2953890 RepID=UPI0020B68D20|nr:calcium-binding protein [Chromobacterium sp. IIBBL 290-4]UTH73314.1 hypothetical protein NKT35_17505 [Chromobacterium sp. IIBBL 290-4]
MSKSNNTSVSPLVIIGGQNGVMNAGSEQDFFVLNAGCGLMVLNEMTHKLSQNTVDTVKLGSGFNASQTKIIRDLSNNLILDFGNGDQLKLTAYFDSALSKPLISFADGSSWDYAAIANQLVFADTSSGSQYLYGLSGVDNRIVGGEADTLTAGAGNDTLTAGHHNTLIAGIGRDTFVLNRGCGPTVLNESSKLSQNTVDVVALGAGFSASQTKIIRDPSSNLILDFGNGDQLTVRNYFSNPNVTRPLINFADGVSWDFPAIANQLVFVDTSSGSQYLYGLPGVDNRIVGGEADTLTAGAGNDTLTAGHNNNLIAGTGRDTFVLNRGCGLTVLNESSKLSQNTVDVVALGAGISASQTKIIRDPSSNLILDFGNGDQLTVRNYFSNPNVTRPLINFADGVSWDFPAIANQLVFTDTSSGSQYLYGLPGVDNRIVGGEADTLTAGAGNDTLTAGHNNNLIAGTGRDTFVLNRGCGLTVLNESSKLSQNTVDVVALGAGISASQTKIIRDPSSNLILDFGNGDQLTVRNYFSNPNITRPLINFANGVSWDFSAIANQLVFTDTSSGSQYLYGLPGVDNRIVGGEADTLTAGAGNDTLTAGHNNNLIAGTGRDTFVLNRGCGQTVLNEAVKLSQNTVDVVKLGAGISAGQTKIIRDPSSNLILDFGNGDQLTVRNYFSNPNNIRPLIHFADGTNWDFAFITNQPPNINPGPTFVAGSNSMLIADANQDTFILNRGCGLTMLNESAKSNLGPIDVVKLGAGISASQTRVIRDLSNSLILDFGNGDQLTVPRYFNNPNANPIARPVFIFTDGSNWDFPAIANQLVFTDTGSGNQLSGLKGVDNRMVGAAGDTLTAGDGKDTLTAGLNNTLHAGSGQDTFVLNRGCGQTMLYESSKMNLGPVDVVKLGTGIRASQTKIIRDLSDNLVLDFGNGDQLTVYRYFGDPNANSSSRPLFSFADGSSWDFLAVTNQLVFTDTSSGNHYLYGLRGVDNRIVGAAGDTLTAGDGKDTLTASLNNTLHAGSGQDTFVLNRGCGQTMLYESSKMNLGPVDVVKLGTGISASQTKIIRDLSNNLILDFGNGDQLTVYRYFGDPNANSSSRPLFSFADGSSWDFLAVANQLVFTDTGSGNQLSGLKGVDNRIVGAAGDTLTAGDGKDTLTASLNNTLHAGSGQDTFVLNRGCGQTMLYESSKMNLGPVDVVKLGTGISASQTKIIRDLSNNLILDFGNGDQLTVYRYFGDPNANSSSRPLFSFTDGSSWDFLAVANQLVFTDTGSGNQVSGLHGVDNRMVGAAGDTLTAGDGKDTLTAGLNNTLHAGSGQDTFVLNRGCGQTMLYESSKMNLGPVDVVKLGTGISASQTKIIRDLSDNLVLDFGNGDQLTVYRYFGDPNANSSSRPLFSFADGSSWDFLAVANQLVFTDTSSGNHYLYGLRGVDNRIVGAAGDTLTAGDGNDVLTAGRNNTLNTGAGRNTFVINPGCGQTVLNAFAKSNSSPVDTVKLGAGINASQTKIIRDLSDNLVLDFGNGDQLTINGYFSNPNYRPLFSFADGRSWDFPAVANQLVFTDASSGNHYLYGLQGVDNRMVGAAGDTLTAGDGMDTLTAGLNNTLNAGAGQDTFVLRAGTGVVTVNDSGAKRDANSRDVLQFADATPDHLWFKYVNGSLEIDVLGTTDAVMVTGWQSSVSPHIGSIQAGGVTLASSDVDKLVHAMAAFSAPPGGVHALPQDQQAQLQPILSASWH